MAQRSLQPEDINRFASPGDPQLSPDGRRLVYTVQRPDGDADRQVTDLWIAPTDGSEEPRRLTSGGRDRDPRWSPDGRTIAFVSNRTGRAQIWLMPADGGEAWHLPTGQAAGSPPEWSPDGTRIAFAARVFDRPEDWEPYPGAPPGDRDRAAAQARKQEAAGAGEDEGDHRRDKTKGDGKKGDGEKGDGDSVSDVKVITRLKYRFDGAGYFGDRRSQVFVVRAAGPGEDPGPAKMVTTGDYDHESPTWTPEGKLLFVASRREDADAVNKQDLWMADPDTAELTLIYEGNGPVALPRVAPDGSRIAFLGHNSSHGRSTTPGLMVIPFRAPLASGRLPLAPEDAANLLADADRPAGNPVSSDVRYAPQSSAPQWSESSNAIYSLMGDRGAAYLIRVEVPRETPGGGAPAAVEAPGPQRLVGGPGRVVATVSYASGVLAYQAGTPVQPEEIYVFRPDDPASERKVTNSNDALLAGLALSPAERFTFKGAGGWDIDGWLLRPEGAGNPGPFPAVLLIHGGPHGVYGASFMFQCQLLASNGFAVVYTNPRGSQSYGQEFAAACVGDWGGKDYQDIMAGIDQAVAAGAADPERLGITGWSYGGYMTSWTITQTRRFKAAVAGAIIYNRHNFWGTSDIGYNFGHHHCGASPWEQPELLLERSAVKYADRVTTPLLLIHGEGDLRCPIEQSEQYFVALRYLGRTAVMVRYPGEYHGFRRPSHKADRFARTLAWFRHYLEPAGS